MEVINVLPTPVAIIPCPFHIKVKESVLQEIEEKGFSDLSYNTGSKDLKHIGHYSVLHDDAKFGRFRNWCEQQAELYAKEVKGDYIQETVQVTDSWINVADKGGFQYPHFHGNSYLSAIYYVNFDILEGKHIPTHFMKDESIFTPNMPCLNFIRNKNTQHNQVNEVIANEGELMIFPSHITHGYETNSGENRITLSMNLMPTIVTNGDYGWRCVNLSPNERLEAFNHKEGLPNKK